MYRLTNEGNRATNSSNNETDIKVNVCGCIFGVCMCVCLCGKNTTMCRYDRLHDKVHMCIFGVWYVYYLHLNNRDHFHCPAPLHIHYCLRCLSGVRNRHWLVTVAVVTVTVVWRDPLYMRHTQWGFHQGTKMQKSDLRANTPSSPAMRSCVQAHLGAVRPVFSSGCYHQVP